MRDPDHTEEALVKELVWHRQYLPLVEREASRTFAVEAATGRVSTYGDSAARVLRLASALRTQLGVAPGDRVAVMSLNSTAFLELYHAGLLGAAVVNPLNLRFAPRELAHVLADSGTEVVFVDAVFAGVIAGVREQAGVRTVVLLGDGPEGTPHDLRYDDLLAAGEEVVPPEPEEDDPALLMYTGGTTGLPKGVVLTHRSLMLTGYHMALSFELTDEPYLAQVPMFHAASMGAVIGGPFTRGGSLVIVPVFDPEAVMSACETHACGNTIMVPTMLAMTFAHPGYRPERLRSLQRLTYGASPMPRPVLERLRADQPQLRLFQGYGMTETAALVSVLRPEDHDREDLLTSAGRPVPGTVVTVQDALGNVLPAGEVGEVCVRGGQVMREYWQRPEETAEAVRDGWYHSGDAGRIDEQGYVFLVDRTKDMIVSGGENVYSTEVEGALASHPAVAQVAVIGVPDDVYGEAVHAVVVLAPGQTTTEAELIAHAKGLIAGYKAPRSVELRAEPLPLSGAMKVLKRELRAPYWAGRERAVH